MASHLSLSVADHVRLNTALVDLYALRDKASLVSHLLATLPSQIDVITPSQMDFWINLRTTSGTSVA